MGQWTQYLFGMRILTPYDQGFTAHLDELEQDARAAARFLYAAETIDHLKARRPTLAAALDRDASFWDAALGALQTAAIAALRRIYDARDEIVSAERLLSHALEHAEALFDAPPESTAAVLRELRAALERHTALYEAAVAPVRHELFTESGRGAMLETLALFQIAQQEDFEKLVVFPQVLHGALSDLHRGRSPRLETPPIDVGPLLEASADDWSDETWEQRAIARDTRRFLVDLEGAPMPEEKVDWRERHED